jgi:type IV pilus assembly protein PilX
VDVSLNKYIAQTSVKAQKGLVLFFALIALVIMSLAAAALIRSVDTGVLVAGNLAFKQSATISGDSGLVSAMDWVTTHAGSLEIGGVNGYYATSTELSTTLPNGGLTSAESATWTSGDAWTDATSMLATGNGLTSGKDSAGNEIRFVVQRMCRHTGPADTSHCLMGEEEGGGDSQGTQEDPQLDAIKNTALSPMYRVTARVSGPKNTVSFVQAYVF